MTTEQASKPKRRLTLSGKLYIWLTIIGMVLIGMGCGISLFELSTYKVANYRALPMDSALPAVEQYTTTLEASYDEDSQFKLDADRWYIGSYDIQYDNTLKDKVIIEVTAPKELYQISLIPQAENYYNLQVYENFSGVIGFFLDMAKDGYILENTPPISLKLTMNEAQAKTFKLNEERYEAQDAVNDYREQLNQVRTEYNDQLNRQRIEYTDELNRLREEHMAQLNDLRAEYDILLENQQIQYEDRIAELERQLDDARTALQ
ncbi:MAG: hypothetical protein IIW67_05600 [Peptococcaceae bacterium]|jgi:hypothetical protein|nr:hypothetical protein [Peptococcaceae bacterium]